MRRFVIVLGLLVALGPTPAVAHVTVQPTEATAGSFARFVVRVPTERDDAATTKVEVQLPEALTSVSFQPKAGWTRTAERKDLAEPIEVFGERVTQYVASVSWEGGRIEPGEFEEFGFSARLPDDPAALAFPALQTYSSGELVRWIGPPDSEEPAGRVRTVRLTTDEEQPGQLELLARLARNDDEGSVLGVVLGATGTALGVVALGVAALGRRRAS
jgi:uncharacterized protein YcnI